jgi:hypothetical protein
MKLSAEFIQTLNDNGYTEAYSVHYFMKRQHMNGQFYNWNYNAIARKCGISHHKAKKYVRLFLDLNWCYRRGLNLCFRSGKRIAEIMLCSSKARLKLNPTDQKEFRDLLQFAPLKQTLKAFSWIKKCSQDLQSSMTPERDERRINKLFDRHNIRAVSDKQKHLIKSNKALAKMFDCSQSMAFKIIKRFIDRGWLAKISTRRNLGMFSDTKGKHMLSAVEGCFRAGKCYFLQEANQYYLIAD